MKSLDRRTLVTLVLVGAVVLVSWLKPIDEVTQSYLAESIKTGVIIYGVARAINAAVSVAQSAEVGVGVSVSPGEALDPLNDLVEHFSEVMTVALVSLVFQKVLAEAAGHWLFNGLVTLAACVFLVSVFLGRHRALAFRLFAIIAVVRLFVPVMVFANGAVDRYFVDPEVQRETQHISGVQKTVDSITIAGLNGEREELEQLLAELEQRMSDIGREIQQLEQDIATLEASKADRPWWLPEGITRNPERRKTNEEIEALQNLLEAQRKELAQNEAQKRVIEEKLECVAKKVRGQSCSWLDKLKDTGDFFSFPDIDFDQTLNSMITLMALMVLRAIVLPLAFWFVLYRVVKAIWRWGTSLQADGNPAARKL